MDLAQLEGAWQVTQDTFDLPAWLAGTGLSSPGPWQLRQLARFEVVCGIVETGP